MGSTWPTSGKTSLTHTQDDLKICSCCSCRVPCSCPGLHSCPNSDDGREPGRWRGSSSWTEAGCGKIGADCAAGGCCAGFKCLNIFVGHKCFPTKVDPANMTPADYADYEKFIDQYINQFIN